jgi:hypothetical protein
MKPHACEAMSPCRSSVIKHGIPQSNLDLNELPILSLETDDVTFQPSEPENGSPEKGPHLPVLL